MYEPSDITGWPPNIAGHPSLSDPAVANPAYDSAAANAPPAPAHERSLSLPADEPRGCSCSHLAPRGGMQSIKPADASSGYSKLAARDGTLPIPPVAFSSGCDTLATRERQRPNGG